MTQQTIWNGAGEIVVGGEHIAGRHVEGKPVDTRAAAAAAIAPLAGGMLRRVFDYVVERGEHGATDEEIALALGMRDSTARARRVELRDAEKICDSTRRRKTRSGRLSIVWIAVGN